MALLKFDPIEFSGGLHAPVPRADSRGVIGAAEFSDVLDQKLAGDPPRARAPRPVPAFRTVPFMPLPGDFPQRTVPGVFRRYVIGSMTAVERGETQVPCPESSRRDGAPRRLVHVRTAEQRRALETLRRLGAHVSALDISDADLKHAFRTLARRYHPDRHPDISDAGRLDLASDFVEASAAYQVLARALTVS